MTSRNQREGRYAGRHGGEHYRLPITIPKGQLALMPGALMANHAIRTKLKRRIDIGFSSALAAAKEIYNIHDLPEFNAEDYLDTPEARKAYDEEMAKP